MSKQGGHKVGEKNSRSFPGFFRAINLIFHRLSQQKVTRQLTATNSILADIYLAVSRLAEIPMILFTQSAAVLHKYLNDERKILRLLQFFPEAAQNSLRIPWVIHVQRNPWVFQVFQVCGHPVKTYHHQHRQQNGFAFTGFVHVIKTVHARMSNYAVTSIIINSFYVTITTGSTYYILRVWQQQSLFNFWGVWPR